MSTPPSHLDSFFSHTRSQSFENKNRVSGGHQSPKRKARIARISFWWFPHFTSSERSGQCSTQETFVWPVTEANYIIIQQVNKWVMKGKSSAHLEPQLHLRIDSVVLTLSAALRFFVQGLEGDYSWQITGWLVTKLRLLLHFCVLTLAYWATLTGRFGAKRTLVCPENFQ